MQGSVQVERRLICHHAHVVALLRFLDPLVVPRVLSQPVELRDHGFFLVILLLKAVPAGLLQHLVVE